MPHTVQTSFNTAAAFMSHDDDHFDFENFNRIFNCGRSPIKSIISAAGRDNIGHITRDKHFAGISIKNIRRVNAAIRTGNQHDLGALPLSAELFIELFLTNIIACTKGLIASD